MASASASASYYTFLHLPNPIHFHHLSSSPARRLALSSAPRFPVLALSSAVRLRSPDDTAARSGPKRRVRARPLVFETEAEAEEEDEVGGEGTRSDEEEEEEQEWAGGNGGAARGEDGDETGGIGEGAGEGSEEDLSSWTQRRPRPRELFVCNLPRRCGVDDLVELFRPYGTVLSVEVSRDAETGISRGCGFVTMRSLAEARTAINALDGFDLDGREMLVKLASDVVSSRRNPSLSHTPPMKDHIFESPHKIYVGNIAWSVQPQDLREYFTQCGTVVSTRLLTDRKGGRSRVYGFLSFSSAEELEAALRLDNTDFHGRNLIVREAQVKSPDALSP